MFSQHFVELYRAPLNQRNSMFSVTPDISTMLFNNILHQEHFQLPTLEDITTWLSGAYRKLDANQLYEYRLLQSQPYKYSRNVASWRAYLHSGSPPTIFLYITSYICMDNLYVNWLSNVLDIYAAHGPLLQCTNY